ncbi:kinesin-like nuclear fusion protein [Vermiconidia calcicola]|uniref:Kinesin-like nuclear fusion protein n=1 Tax=Vermiconidia calcicola TaxID=1690605 RepID=A0ACC3MQK0_9PEZI|nr:kinesin-like nuclear fusion protein [Vermiconidia calcicola]
MDRPPSQLENVRPSGLKPPSRLPAMSHSTGQTLRETSQSDINARSAGAGGAMLPPPTHNGGVKHKIPGLPEPPTKRKTLAERAAEPLNALRSHMQQPSRSNSNLAKSDAFPSNIAGVGRSQSGMGNISSTNGYRTTSVASTSSSTSCGRPLSRHHGSRTIAGRPPSVADSLTTTMEEEAETEAGVMGKRKGTPILSFNDPITIPKRPVAHELSLQRSTASLRSKFQQSGSYTRSAYSSTSSRSSSAESQQQHQQPAVRSASTTSVSSSSQQEAGSQRSTSLVSAFAGLSISARLQAQERTTSAPKSTSSKHRPSLSPVKEQTSPSKIPKYSCTPRVRHVQSTQALVSTPSSPLKHKASGLRTPAASGKKSHGGGGGYGRGDDITSIPCFLTKEKLTPSSVPAWDTKGRLEDMEHLYAQLRTQFASADDSKRALEETLEFCKSQVHELRQLNKELSAANKNLSSDLERARTDLHATTTDLRQARRDHERDVQEVERKHERDLSDLYAKQTSESHRLERELEKIADQGEREHQEARRAWEKQKDDETAELTTQHWEEIEELRTRHAKEVERLEQRIEELERSGQSRATESATEVQGLRDRISGLEGQVEGANANVTILRSQMVAAEARTASLEQEKTSLISKTHFLEGNQEAQSQEFTTMREQLEAAKAAENSVLEKLREEEMVRRKLNAQILELKGNIRVFARTRPLLPGEEEPARVEYPDENDLDGGKEMVVHGPKQLSATGKERIEKHAYAFDRIFSQDTKNQRVFEDCRELIQSVVDGYNVSILSYGQTGSGKTFGMSGPEGIIPSSIALLLAEMQRLREKGWEYAVEASFVEVYNETLNDLLGDAKSWDDAGGGGEDLNGSVRGSKNKKERHEIHHDALTGKTTVTNLTAVSLWPPPENDGAWPPAAPAASTKSTDAESYTERAVTRLLDTAAKNRRVAATKSNERSSRSHSIFMLTLRGSCAATNESSEGVLNLVDLAGSERLKASGAEGNRMKETQAINKSLSSLGDVIAALGIDVPAPKFSWWDGGEWKE